MLKMTPFGFLIRITVGSAMAYLECSVLKLVFCLDTWTKFSLLPSSMFWQLWVQMPPCCFFSPGLSLVSLATVLDLGGRREGGVPGSHTRRIPALSSPQPSSTVRCGCEHASFGSLLLRRSRVWCFFFFFRIRHFSGSEGALWISCLRYCCGTCFCILWEVTFFSPCTAIV